MGDLVPAGPGGLLAWWLGTGGGWDGALKWGGGGMVGIGRTGGSGMTGGSPAAGGAGRGGRGMFLADRVLVSNMLDLLFTGGGPTGSTGRRQKKHKCVSHDQLEVSWKVQTSNNAAELLPTKPPAGNADLSTLCKLIFHLTA